MPTITVSTEGAPPITTSISTTEGAPTMITTDVSLDTDGAPSAIPPSFGGQFMCTQLK